MGSVESYAQTEYATSVIPQLVTIRLCMRTEREERSLMSYTGALFCVVAVIAVYLGCKC